MPYRSLFDHVTYESIDFCKVDKEYAAPTYIGDATAIPVSDGRYDFLVLMTQVLEHLPDPVKVLCEVNRVMKPASTLWLSCPLFYQEHEQPYDFFRYTQFGLRHLLGSCRIPGRRSPPGWKVTPPPRPIGHPLAARGFHAARRRMAGESWARLRARW